MVSQIYNIATWIYHKFFHVPIRLKATYDNKRKNAKVTVIFLHGISATSQTWLTTLKIFNLDPELDEVRLVALDLLGFGKSLKADWLKYNEAEYLSALHLAIKKIKPHGAIVLVGHSMGSLICADYAVNYHKPFPIREMILVSPPVLMADELAKLPDKAYLKTYGSLYQIATDVPAAEVVAKIVQKFSSFRSDYLKTKAFQKSMKNIILNPHNYQTFVKIHIPTLIIHGHFDPLVMSSNLKRALKHNEKYLHYTSVIGHHDISAGKRAKILLEIKKILREESVNEAV